MVRGLCLWVAGAILMGVAGCEDGGGSSGTPPVDVGDNDPNRVVAFGDSITDGYLTPGPSYPELLGQKTGKNVANEGVPGARSSYGASRIQAILNEYHPGYIVIFFGANDVIMGDSLEDTTANLRSMVASAKANQTIPVLCTLTPVAYSHMMFSSGFMRVSAAARQIAAEEGIPLADLEAAFNDNPVYLLDDGLHLTPSGNDLVATIVADAL